MEALKNNRINHYFIAPYKLRIYAFLIDYLVIIGYGILLVFLSFLLRSFFVPLFSKSPFTAELIGFCLITLPVMLYFISMEASRKGGTLGKRKMNIRVVNSDGGKIGVARALFRSIIKFIPWEISHFAVWNMVRPSHYSNALIMSILLSVNILAILYILFPLTNKHRKNIYDWITNTKVIRSE